MVVNHGKLSSSSSSFPYILIIYFYGPWLPYAQWPESILWASRFCKQQQAPWTMAEDFPMKSTNSNGWFNATATESTESYRIHIITCYDTISRYLNVSYYFRSWPIYHSLISLFGCNSYGNVSTITMDDSSTIARREKATLITPRCGSIKRPAGSDQGQHEKRTLSVSGAFVLDHMDRMDAIVCIWSVYMQSYVYITLHYITLHYTTLHYITLHYMILHFHYITLHYIYTHTRTRIYI